MKSSIHDNVYPNAFWWPLTAMLLLSASFMQFPGIGMSELGNTSSLGEVKFAMHLVAYIIMGVLFIGHYRGIIPNSSDLKLYAIYCIFVIVSVFVYALRIGDANVVMFARMFDITLFMIVILVFSRMEIEDSFRITFIAISAPILIILLIYPFSPELVLQEKMSPSSGEIVYRLGGQVVHPNHLGACAAISLIMVLGSRLKVFFKVLLSLIFFSVVVYAQSRTALLVLFISIIGSLILLRQNTRYKVIGSCILGIVTAGIIVAYQAGFGGHSTHRLFDYIDTLGGRTNLWEVALTEFFNRGTLDLLFGMDPFISSTTFYVHQGFSTFGLHNSYLHVLVGCGLFAVMVYTPMLVCLLRVNAERRGMTLSLRAIVIYILVTGLMEQTAAVFLNFFTILLPVLIAQCFQQRKFGHTQFQMS